MSVVLSGGEVFTGNTLIRADIFIDKGKIANIGKDLAGDERIDITGLAVLPGLIDAHVHFREPGHPHKEDFRSGSKAAAAGGVTTILDMPNNTPPILTQRDLDQKRVLAKKSLVNFGLYIGATKENLATINATDAIAIKVYLGSSTGDLLLDDLGDFVTLVASTNKLIVAHCENEQLIRHFSRLHAQSKQHHKMRDNIAAAIATGDATITALHFDKRLHIAHLSTKEEVGILTALKAPNITCEVSPHHLFLTKHYFVQHGNRGKMNPPLRSEEDRAALWQAIGAGVIDIIATDHAPHTQEEKASAFEHAPCGVPGVQTTLPLMLTAMHEGKLTLADVVRLCCTRPAQLFGIAGRGIIEQGAWADLTIVDLNREETITNAQQHSRSGWTPFDGTRVRGWPVMTFVNGICVYNNGAFNEDVCGQEVGR